jgi:hypothetical protein
VIQIAFVSLSCRHHNPLNFVKSARRRLCTNHRHAQENPFFFFRSCVAARSHDKWETMTDCGGDDNRTNRRPNQEKKKKEKNRSHSPFKSMHACAALSANPFHVTTQRNGLMMICNVQCTVHLRELDVGASVTSAAFDNAWPRSAARRIHSMPAAASFSPRSPLTRCAPRL